MTAVIAHELHSAGSLVSPPRPGSSDLSAHATGIAPQRRARDSRAVMLMLAVLLVSTAIVLAALLYSSSLRYPLNYNEGWNAFWAHRAELGQPIYPPPDAMVFNNYPPLSFLLIGALGRLGIDVWIVGRIVAWLSFAGCAVLISAVLRTLGSAGPAAALGAVLFCGLMALNYHTYLGMDDPQLTAHLGMLVGLYLLVRGGLMVKGGGPSRRSVMLAAVVIVASGFIKHNLFALPLTITVWLALYRRDLLVAWLLTAAAGLAAGFLLCQVTFGADFLAGLATPRAWAAHYAYAKLVRWLPPIALPVLVGLSPLRRLAQDPTGVLLGLFTAFALAVGCLSLAGDGVVYNALFELVIASSLAIGYLLGRTGSNTQDTWIALAAVALVAWSSSLAAAAMIVYRHDWIAQQDQCVAMAERSVAIIAAQPGPALCEDLLLCYWAGKPFEVDTFNYLQAVHTGRRDAILLLSQIEQGRFSTIQLNPIDNRMPPRVQAVIGQHYKPVAGLPGLFVRQDAGPKRLAGDPPPHSAASAR